MSKMIFVNLPVRDLAKATAFYEAVGFQKNEMFSDDTASGMVLSDIIHVMLLTHDKFSQFTPRRIAQAHETCQVMLALSAEGRAEVDGTLDKAIMAGGREHREREDLSFMYSRAFEDLDGHVWELFFMDVAEAQKVKEAEAVPA